MWFYRNICWIHKTSFCCYTTTSAVRQSHQQMAVLRCSMNAWKRVVGGFCRVEAENRSVDKKYWVRRGRRRLQIQQESGEGSRRCQEEDASMRWWVHRWSFIRHAALECDIRLSSCGGGCGRTQMLDERMMIMMSNSRKESLCRSGKALYVFNMILNKTQMDKVIDQYSIFSCFW